MNTNSINVGDMAPDFTLDVDGGRSLSLSDQRPDKVVLFFYPKDNTSGCTRQAKAFTALKTEFTAAGARVIGISADSIPSHDKFKTMHELDVDLVSDPEKQVIERYGVWREKKLYGRSFMGIERSTFLIDGRGRIAKVWRKVKVPDHAEAVLEAVRACD